MQAYLYRVAHNWVMDTYRRKTPPSVPLHEDIQVQLQDNANGNPAALVSDQMEIERVRSAMLSLPKDQRQVIVLRFLEDLSHEEVASILGKSAEATRAIQYRALASLKKMLLES